MENNELKKISDDLSLSFLEGLDDDVANLPQAFEIDRLLDADRYNVKLDELESVQVQPEMTFTPSEKTEDEAVEDIENPNTLGSFIDNADVRLQDVIRKFLDVSLRPVVIICDDRVQYVNSTALEMLDIIEADIMQSNFLDYVAENEWNLLAENIGVMLTDAKSIKIHLKSKNGKVFETELEAIYIPDDNHFAFVLMGSRRNNTEVPKIAASSPVISLYDPLTGLPNFYLFEDRVQVAVNNASYKEPKDDQTMIAVVGVSIDNIFNLRQIGMEDFVLKKIASKLAFSLKKNYTTARGLKYQFWVLMNDLPNVNALDAELRKIKAIFDDGVEDNFTSHTLNTSIGVSVFPLVARSGKKLLDQAISAVKQAQAENGGVVFYSEEPRPEN